MGKRILLSWAAILFIGLLAGFGFGFFVRAMASEKTGDEPVMYGSADDRDPVEEVPMDWDYEGLEFVPLDVDMDDDMQEFVFYISAAYNIDFKFIMAVIQKESNYIPDKVSCTGDYGLMQINEINHESITEALGIEDFTDPYQNVWAGCYILQGLFEKYGDVNMVLMAYNLGETGASILWNQGIYETTYSRSVLQIQDEMEVRSND